MSRFNYLIKMCHLRMREAAFTMAGMARDWLTLAHRRAAALLMGVWANALRALSTPREPGP